MALLIIILFYTLINLYVVSRIIKWFKALNEFKYKDLYLYIFISIYILFYITPILGYFLPISNFQKTIQLIANSFLGVLNHMCIIAIISDLFKLIYSKLLKKDTNFLICKKYLISSCIISVLFVSFLSLYGIIHVKHIYINEYDININKETNIDSLKIALVADLHLGYNIGSSVIHNMVDKINNEDVDLVVLAGDIFDNSTKTVDNIDKVIDYFKSINSKYGVYATFGNHDIEEKLFAGFTTSYSGVKKRSKKMEEILKKADITLLDDEIVDKDSFYLIGRKDYEKPGDGTKTRSDINDLLDGIDINKPIIVIDHEPRNLKELSKYPIDLYLSGHTHNGQFFPLTLGTNIMWDNAYGYKKYGNLNSVVTSGIGVYGPNMRIGSDSEIVIINVFFK